MSNHLAASQSHDPFVMDVQKIREDARKHMSDGPVTQSYGADRETVLKLLNDALATEIVCVLRYKRHHFMAKGINSEAVAAEFARARDGGTGTRRPFCRAHRATGRRAGFRA